MFHPCNGSSRPENMTNATRYGALGLSRDVIVAGHRIADGSIPGTLAGLPSRESVREFRPLGLRGSEGRRGILDEMQGHPRIGAAIRGMRVEMQRQDTMWVAQDADSREQLEFVSLIEKMIASDRIVTDRQDEGSSWGNVLGWLVDEWVYGFALANPSWDGDVLELYPVMPSSVRRWNIDRGSDEWVSVDQRTELRGVTIPREALIYVRSQGAPGELEGHSMLRPVIYAYENWKMASAAMVMIMGAASGVVDISAPKGGSDSEDWQALVEQAIAFEQGQRRWFMHEDGYEIDLKFPAAGATQGIVEVMQYWDAQIDQALGRSMQSLGFSATGSRALGEELSEESREQARANLAVLLRRFGVSLSQVIADRVGYDGPLPLLEPLVERRREVEGRVQVLGSAVQAGLIRWTPEREQELAEELDLAAIEEIAPEPEELSSEPNMKPTEAMADAAKRGLELRAEWGRGGTDTGVARARDISNRSNLSPETWRRMKAFFDRHEQNRDAEKREDDGGPTAGWIAWLLWGGDPGRSRANAVVASLDSESASACCPGHVRLASSVQVEDFDGEPFAFGRELDDVERFVSWVRNEAIRLAADDYLQRAVNEVAAAMRQELWRALPDEPGTIPGSVQRLTSEYADQFQAVVRAYAIRIADEVATQSAAERHRQVAPDGTRTFVMGDLAAIERKLGGQVEAMTMEAAEVMASRVRGRVVDHWMSGGIEEDFEAAQPRLYAEALPVGNLIESQGRLVEGYANAPGEGMIPVEAIRTSVRDGDRCGHCAARDLTRYDLTTREGVEDMLAERLPDPECEGAPKCRCGWVLRYARVSGEEFERIRDEVGGLLGGAV